MGVAANAVAAGRQDARIMADEKIFHSLQGFFIGQRLRTQGFDVPRRFDGIFEKIFTRKAKRRR